MSRSALPKSGNTMGDDYCRMPALARFPRAGDPLSSARLTRLCGAYRTETHCNKSRRPEARDRKRHDESGPKWQRSRKTGTLPLTFQRLRHGSLGVPSKHTMTGSSRHELKHTRSSQLWNFDNP